LEAGFKNADPASGYGPGVDAGSTGFLIRIEVQLASAMESMAANILAQ
jgi:hypothetical protein